MSTDTSHPTPIPAVDNKGQASQLGMDAIPTTEMPAVDNKGQANQLDMNRLYSGSEKASLETNRGRFVTPKKLFSRWESMLE